jgi:hypothetical protein
MLADTYYMLCLHGTFSASHPDSQQLPEATKDCLKRT